MPQEVSSWFVQLPFVEDLLALILLLVLVTLWVGMIGFFFGSFIMRAARACWRPRRRYFLDRVWPSCECHGHRKDMVWCFETIYGEDLYACPQCSTQVHRGSNHSVASRFPPLDGREDGLTLSSGRVVKPFAQQPEGLLVASTAGDYLVRWSEIVPDSLPDGDLTAWVSGGIKESA